MNNIKLIIYSLLMIPKVINIFRNIVGQVISENFYFQKASPEGKIFCFPLLHILKYYDIWKWNVLENFISCLHLMGLEIHHGYNKYWCCLTTTKEVDYKKVWRYDKAFKTLHIQNHKLAFQWEVWEIKTKLRNIIFLHTNSLYLSM